MVTNPLIATDNTVPALFSGVPVGSTVYKWDASSQSYTIKDLTSSGWDIPSMTIIPGEGVIFRNPQTSPITVSFVGEVEQGYTNQAVPQDFSIEGSIVPQGGLVVSDLGVPLLGTDEITTKENGVDTTYTLQNDGTWSPHEPSIEVGEAFWTDKSIGNYWDRGFSVWP